MAGNQSTIDVKKVNDAGETIVTQSKKMYDELNSIKEIINNSKSYFQSEGGDGIRNSFNSTAEEFSVFKSYVDKYGYYLKSYSDVHLEVDKTIEGIADKYRKK